MGYRFAVERQDYADLASGTVLRSAPGYPAFPVRLASESFLRAWELLRPAQPLRLWDPCCGSGYLLSVLALSHRERLRGVIASDVDPEAVQLAQRNLEMLTDSGLRQRGAELRDRAERFDKPTYSDSARSAERLRHLLAEQGGDLPFRCGTADAFDVAAMRQVLAGTQPDLAMVDIPYGEQTDWYGAAGDAPIAQLLYTVAPLMAESGLIVVAMRGRKVPLPVPAVERFKVGTRAVAMARVPAVRE